MANLPEKNITTVDAITSIPSNTNVYVNANGQFVQASINDVVKASNVVNDETLSAMKEFIDSQFKTLTGSPILAQGTADGYMPSFKGKGASLQNSYSGYQLFDASKLPTATVGGATVTNNRDGSFTISGSGNLTSLFSRQYTYSADEAVKLLKVGQCTLKSEAVTMPYISFVLYDTESNSVFKQLNNSNSTKSSIDITEEIMTNISNGKYSVKLFIYGSSGLAIKPGTIKPMLYQDGDGTFEPFTGAQPSPNPQYPQPIKSKGDCGWFDGELLSGVWLYPTGEYGQNGQYVCGKNIIPCKENDNINIEYAETTSSIGILYYDKDMNYLSYDYIDNGNKLSVTAPANTSYFRFNVKNDNGITPSTAKKIVVTINGTYAVKVTSVGKNKFYMYDSATNANWNGLYVTYKENSSDMVLNGSIITDDFAVTITEFPLTKGTYTASVYGLNDNNIDRVYITNPSEASVIVNFIQPTAPKTFTLQKDMVVRMNMVFTKGTSYSNKKISIQIEHGDTATDYEPYEEHEEWIPLSEPLRENDTIECIDGVYGVVRGSGYGRITSVTKNNTDTNDYLYYQHFGDKKRMTTVKCNTLIDRYLHNLIGGNTTDKVGISGRGDNKIIYINVGYYLSRDGYENNVEAMNTWLAENPTYVEYKLAEPTFEPFTDQSPFYRLKTFEGVTHISASDDMEMVVEVPTSRAGGVASIGWSKGNLAQIETQNLSAKIAELQTAIVNS